MSFETQKEALRNLWAILPDAPLGYMLKFHRLQFDDLNHDGLMATLRSIQPNPGDAVDAELVGLLWELPLFMFLQVTRYEKLGHDAREPGRMFRDVLHEVRRILPTAESLKLNAAETEAFMRKG